LVHSTNETNELTRKKTCSFPKQSHNISSYWNKIHKHTYVQFI